MCIIGKYESVISGQVIYAFQALFTLTYFVTFQGLLNETLAEFKDLYKKCFVHCERGTYHLVTVIPVHISNIST